MDASRLIGLAFLQPETTAPVIRSYLPPAAQPLAISHTGPLKRAFAVNGQSHEPGFAFLGNRKQSGGNMAEAIWQSGPIFNLAAI